MSTQATEGGARVNQHGGNRPGSLESFYFLGITIFSLKQDEIFSTDDKVESERTTAKLHWARRTEPAGAIRPRSRVCTFVLVRVIDLTGPCHRQNREILMKVGLCVCVRTRARVCVCVRERDHKLVSAGVIEFPLL